MTYIHGETDPAEIDRLEKQARFLTRWILDGVEAGPGARVLDLACGTGAMMRRLAARLPDVQLFGCDLSRSQLRAARARSPGAPLVNGNAAALPVKSRSLDLVHCSWLLEHVKPGVALEILREVRRILAPGGVAWMTEVENDILNFWPRLPAVEPLFRTLWEAQEKGGGDPIVGRKLYGLCRAAGFEDVQLFPTVIHVHQGSPPGYLKSMLEEFAEILQSAREALPGRDVDGASAQLFALEKDPAASVTVGCFRARVRA